jgi:hypothetical protein
VLRQFRPLLFGHLVDFCPQILVFFADGLICVVMAECSNHARARHRQATNVNVRPSRLGTVALPNLSVSCAIVQDGHIGSLTCPCSHCRNLPPSDQGRQQFSNIRRDGSFIYRCANVIQTPTDRNHTDCYIHFVQRFHCV